MTPLFHVHELVHANKQISNVESQGHFEPRLEVTTVRLTVVDSEGKEHDEAADGRPHNLKELDPLTHDLFLSSSHLLVVELSSLVMHVHLMRVTLPRTIHRLLLLLVLLSLVVIVHPCR